MTTLRRADVDDWRLVRDVRLRALADAPTAFGAVLDQARELPDDEWRRRLTYGVTVVGLDDGGRGVAMGGAFAPQDGASLYLWGMWTDPAVRGRGVGGRLLDDLLAWCRETGAADPGAVRDGVRLHVSEDNPGARGLYVSRGFAPTGVWERLRAGSDLRCEELRLGL
ncbi:GNAT family N-acetyltransferase [Nocardioides sp. C4-1]|uniref:GNAT family N-acetyltransferase n=1 Tax=Nocardioides sp. C4-1 TaxID=3151851 RepID=UPI003266A266